MKMRASMVPVCPESIHTFGCTATLRNTNVDEWLVVDAGSGEQERSLNLLTAGLDR